ncbi:glycosyltransferase family 4 protein [Marinobacter sp.]|uniref:glycosyltransferase family 4 protein n=1 Tax=Marinobacter sp. TaxID=50741 RepID=UPI00356ACD86
MRKILLVSEIFPPKTGGSGRWFWEIYRRLPKQHVACLVGQHPQAGPVDKIFPHPVFRAGLASREWGLRSRSGLRFYFRTWRALVKLVNQEGIGQVHCGRVLPEGLASLLLKLTHRIPYTCYVHGEDVETALTSRELAFLTGRVMHHAEHIIANSQNSKRILTEKWGMPDHKVTVMTPGVDIEKFCPDPASFRPPHWTGKRVILTVGRLQKRKGHDMMIRALPELIKIFPDIHYCIVGDGDERCNLETLSINLGVAEHVEFAGEIDDREMVVRYRHCELFALPNRRVGNDDEGFGMVLLEAQACGRSVLAGDSGGTSETMVEGETGVVCDCTAPEHIVAKLRWLLSEPELLVNMGIKGRAHMQENFSWSALTSRALTIFQ